MVVLVRCGARSQFHVLTCDRFLLLFVVVVAVAISAADNRWCTHGVISIIIPRYYVC